MRYDVYADLVGLRLAGFRNVQASEEGFHNSLCQQQQRPLPHISKI